MKEKDARGCQQKDKGHKVFIFYRRTIHGQTLTTKQDGHMSRTQFHRMTFSRIKDPSVPWRTGPFLKKSKYKKKIHKHRVCYISHQENSYPLLNSLLFIENPHCLALSQELNLPFTKCISTLHLHNTVKFMRHFHIFFILFLHSPVR